MDLATITDKANLQAIILPQQFMANQVHVYSCAQSDLEQLKSLYAGFQDTFGKPKSQLEKQLKNFMAVRLVLIQLLGQHGIMINPINPEKPTQADQLPDPAKLFLKKNDVGRPYLTNTDLQISLSHSHNYVAVMASQTNCGIDIQVYDQRLLDIAKRVFSDTEQAWAQQQIQPLTVLWAAKEAVYKWVGISGLHFQRDILIEILETQTYQNNPDLIGLISAKAHIQNLGQLGQSGKLEIVLTHDFAVAAMSSGS